MLNTIVFFDGQHLYRSAKDAWRPLPAVGPSNYSWPSYDVEKLADTLVSRDSQRILKQIRFYTGVPDNNSNPPWHGFWTNKLRYLKSRGVETYRGYINPAGHEKGVDVRIAIDLVQLTYEQEYDVAMIISQDWDFGPAVRLCKEIARDQGRQLIFESCFPVGPGRTSTRGIPGTNWVQIDQATYDACFDPRDYR
ncbi:MAG: NYN domain-containing protein [Dehalococcoidia bacterium]|nr:NYN domain-containing protein [Dehalococcoidia bacterium]